MDIDHLRILRTVAKNGSMNRAAAELHTVQSNVTARVRQLEEELGVSLFVRHSRGVTLSDAGERLLSYSGRIDALFQEAIAAVKENGIPKGALRIGALEQTVSLRLTPVLAQYTVRYPAVALTVTTGTSSNLLEQVLDQDLDGAFVLGPVSQPEVRAEPIFVESLALVTGPSTRTLQDLQQAEGVKALVLEQGCSYRELLSSILESRGIKHQPLAVASFDAIRSLVQSNVGVTLLPIDLLVGPWAEANVAIHELSEPSAQVEMVFISRTDRPNSSALEAFLMLSRALSNISI